MLFDRSNIVLPYYVHALVALIVSVLPVLAFALAAWPLGYLMYALMALQFWLPSVLAALILIFIFQEVLEHVAYNSVIPALILWGIGLVFNWPVVAALFQSPFSYSPVVILALGFLYAWGCSALYAQQIRKGVAKE